MPSGVKEGESERWLPVGGWAAGKMEMLLPVQAALVGSRLGKDFCFDDLHL